jgi:hypothetical protein
MFLYKYMWSSFVKEVSFEEKIIRRKMRKMVCVGLNLNLLYSWDETIMTMRKHITLKDDDKRLYLYLDVVRAIFRKRSVNSAGRDRVKDIWRSLGTRSKNITEDGKKSKVRIIQRILYEEKKPQFTLHFYEGGYRGGGGTV